MNIMKASIIVKCGYSTQWVFVSNKSLNVVNVKLEQLETKLPSRNVRIISELEMQTQIQYYQLLLSHIHEVYMA